MHKKESDMNRRILGQAAGLIFVGAICAALAGGAEPGGHAPPPDPAIAYADNGIKVMNGDGTNQRTLVALRNGNTLRNLEFAQAPAWSPTGDEIVFWADLGGVPGLRMVPVAGGPPRLIVRSQPTSPDWSPVPTPDGQHKIVYTDLVSYPSSPFAVTLVSDVFLVNPDGSGRINLTNTLQVSESYPTWAPDGRRLAFSRRGVELVIVELDVVNGSLAVVSETVRASGGLIFDLHWAKASEKVAFSLVLGGDLGIVTLDLDNPLATPFHLTWCGSGDPRWASFSPDDTRLVYYRGGTNEGIYTVNADGSGEMRICRGGREPSWRRTP
jgi:Tol biopolymer transport system component